jgi:hypothetical protein
MSHAVTLLAVIFHKPGYDLDFVHTTLKKYQAAGLSTLLEIWSFC